MNQIQSSGRGGRRPGAGRKKGSANQRTREIADRAAAEGITPLEYLLRVMRDESQEPKDRLDAAKSAAPYMHPRLNSIEHTGANGGPIEQAVTLEVAGVPSHQG